MQARCSPRPTKTETIEISGFRFRRQDFFIVPQSPKRKQAVNMGQTVCFTGVEQSLPNGSAPITRLNCFQRAMKTPFASSN